MFIKRPKKLQGFLGGRAEGDGGVPKKILGGEEEELRLELIEPSGASGNTRGVSLTKYEKMLKKEKCLNFRRKGLYGKFRRQQRRNSVQVKAKG